MDPKNAQPNNQPTPENPAPAAPAPFVPPEEYNPLHKVHVAPARSFSTDLANAIREKGGSVVRIAIAEEEKHKREFQENSASSQKNVIFIIAASLIVLAAVGSVVWAYAYKRSEVTVAPVSAPVLPPSIVDAETAQGIDITGMKPADIISAVNAIVTNPNLQPGVIKNIIITLGTGSTGVRIPASQFLSALQTHAPSDLVSSLSPEYMLGVYEYQDQVNNLFLIVKGTAHDFLLAGMLEWEPKLFADMVPLFNINTTTLPQSELQNPPFSDLVIENHDTRAVLDSNKKPLLFYSFLDDDTIIIATDSKTLTEVVSRF